MDNIVSIASEKMQKAIELLIIDLASVKTGRAAPSLIDSVEVNVYNGSARMKMMELATITASDPQTLTITPFDPSIIEEIQKGLLEANLGLTPSSDGHVIRINIPPLTTERREELTHLLKQRLENGKILIRQVRQESFKEIKNLDLSEDEVSRLEKEVQKITDEFIGKIDAIGSKKEEELMTI